MKAVYRAITIAILLLCLSCSSNVPGQRSSSELKNATDDNSQLDTFSVSAAESLYDRMGGREGLEKVIDNLVKNIGRDKVIFHFFADSNVTRFKKMQFTHLCYVTDGPCEYDGDTMQDIHTGMNIRESDFNHLVELLIRAMESSGIAYPLQNELLSRLAPLRKEIIKI